MEVMQLKAKKRKELGKSNLKPLRTEGIVPGVVYGPRQKTEYLSLDEHDLGIFLRKTSEHSLVELKVGNKKPALALLVEVQHHPVTDRVLHVDFKYIPPDKPVDIMVPFDFVGESPGVRSGGLLMPRLHDLYIRAVPDKVPESFEVDISELDFDSAIHVKDLEVSEGIEILNDHDQTVATVIRPKAVLVEEEEEEVLEEEIAEEEAVEGAEAPAKETEQPEDETPDKE